MRKRLKIDSEDLSPLKGGERRATKETEVEWPYITRTITENSDKSVFKKIRCLEEISGFMEDVD